MDEYVAVLKKYAEFEGRASRREYWMFQLVHVAVSLSLAIFSFGMGFVWNGYGILSSLYSAAIFLPSLGVAIRRMHDVNKSGWFSIVPIYNLYLSVQPSDSGNNKYGSAPSTEVK